MRGVLEMSERAFPVPDRLFGHCKCLSLERALLRSALTARPRKYHEPADAEYQDTGAHGEKEPRATRGVGGLRRHDHSSHTPDGRFVEEDEHECADQRSKANTLHVRRPTVRTRSTNHRSSLELNVSSPAKTLQLILN
jgi:hypothetical protein